LTACPVLVTGGAGFIGSHTCKQLFHNGFAPLVIDDLRTGNRRSVKWGALVTGDVLDTATLTQILRDAKPRALIHFAASAYVGESVVDPAKYYRNNVGGMLSVLEACRAADVDKVIFSSSCATYGIPETLPITEATVQAPINPYGRTKLIGENVLEDYAAAYGIKYVALRYFNACGADPEGELGEWHDPETHIIPRALMAASGKIVSLEIFGQDYDTADGTCIRDYVHVSDLARAHVLATQHLLAGGKNLKLNLGTGRGSSIRDVLSSVQRTTAHRVPITILPRRAGDPPALYADARLADEILGFVAELSDLDTIVRTAAPFFGLEVSG
jgi:UDP-arabinose 4-epimerase